MVIIMWFLFAILSALFSSVMMLLIKVGLKGLDTNLGLAIRTVIVAVLCVINILIFGNIKEIKSVSGKTWLWLVLAAVATFLTWLFYFIAVKSTSPVNVMAVSQASIVFTIILSFVFLKEKISIMDIIGSLIILLGVYILVYKG